MNKTSWASLFALVAVISAQAWCQAPAIGSPGGNKSWAVEGVVSGPGGPLPGATVSWVGSGNAKSTTANENGHFTLSDVTPGHFSISAERAGYGQSKPRLLNLSLGTRLEHFDIELQKEAVISGRVLDPEGDPIQNAEVDLWATKFTDGKPDLDFQGQDRTNDLGEYRIAGIREGRYYLEALPKNLEIHKRRPVLETGAGSGPKLGIARRTYYANADSPEAAAPIDLHPGQQTGGLDLQFRNVETYCVTGKVEANNAKINIREGTGLGGFGFSGALPAHEEFEICGVPSGSYRYFVTIAGPPNGGWLPTVALITDEFTLNRRNVALAIPAAVPAFQFSGKVTLVDPEKTIPSGLKIELGHPYRPFLYGESFPVAVQTTGTFLMESVFADTCKLRVLGLPRGYYVQRATQMGRDIRHDTFRPEAGPVQLVLGSDGASISGQVVDDDNQPVHDATVVLVRKEPVAGELPVSQPSDQSGRFDMNSEISPGQYRLFAFSGLLEGEAEDPDLIRAHVKDASEVDLSSKAAVAVTLTVHSAH